MARKITPEMIDWDAFKENIENNIANERIWGLGGHEFADSNIADYEEELDAIENEDYDFIFDKYDDDYLEDYLLAEYDN